MRLARVSSALLFVAAVGCTSDNDGPTGAPKLQQVAYYETKDVAVSGELGASASKYVKANDLLTSPGDDWQVRDARAGENSMQHVRMHQMHNGVRVWGGDVVVHTNGSKFSYVTGNRVTDLVGFDTRAKVSDSTALATAKAEYALRSKDPKVALRYDRENTELVILPRDGAETRLAWHTSFYTELQAGIEPALMHYFVDAKTGEVLHRYNGIHTVFAQASGPGGNAKVPHPWVNRLDVQLDGGTYKAETPRLLTLDMQNQTSGGVVGTGSLDAFGDAALNDAHGHAETVLQTLESFGFNSIDNAGFQIKSRVHYSSNYENAFWDGEQMTYGDGQNYFYPLSGDVDVVAHEVNHGFTSFHSNLIYSGESGGMNESFSDISGAVAEHFEEGDAGDFDVGADIFKEVGAALRYMCDPTADGSSIDHYSDYAGQDVHYTSGIMNKAFCFAARRMTDGTTTTDASAVAVLRLAKAFYKANESYWTESSTFAQGCQGTVDAARELAFTDAEIDHLKNSWIDVGVYCDGAVEPLICDDTFTTDTGEVTSPNHPANYPDNFKRTYCIMPASGNAATVSFPVFNTEEGWDFVTVKDGVTGDVLSTTSGTTPPAPATSTIVVIKFTSDSIINATGWKATW